MKQPYWHHQHLKVPKHSLEFCQRNRVLPFKQPLSSNYVAEWIHKHRQTGTNFDVVKLIVMECIYLAFLHRRKNKMEIEYSESLAGI